MIGISVDTLNNYKKLTELIPELEDLVETGILAPNTALALVKYMSPSEQEKFVNSMDITKKITTKNYCCKKNLKRKFKSKQKKNMKQQWEDLQEKIVLQMENN